MFSLLLRRFSPDRQRVIAVVVTYALFVVGPAAVLAITWLDGSERTAAIVVACVALAPAVLMFLPSPIDGVISLIELVRIFFSRRGSEALRVREPVAAGPFIERERGAGATSIGSMPVAGLLVGVACLALGAFGVRDGIEAEQDVRTKRNVPEMTAEILERTPLPNNRVEIRARGFDPIANEERTVTVRLHKRDVQTDLDLYRLDGTWTPKARVDNVSALAWVRMIAGGFLVLAGLVKVGQGARGAQSKRARAFDA